MEVPASNRTEREKRPDSGSDRSDFPAFLSFVTCRLAGTKLVTQKKQPFDRRAAPTVRWSRFCFGQRSSMAATEVESNA